MFNLLFVNASLPLQSFSGLNLVTNSEFCSAVHDGTNCYWRIGDKACVCTSVAEGSRICRWATVTGKAVGSLHTASLVLAECAVAAAVAWTPCLNPRSDLCSLLQVQSDTVQLQRANTTPKSLLPGCCASWRHTKVLHQCWQNTH